MIHDPYLFFRFILLHSELLEDDIKVSPATDLSGLAGVIIWAVLGMDPETFRKHIDQEPKVIANRLMRVLGRKLASLLLALVRKDPAARPDIEAIFKELDIPPEHFANSYLWDTLKKIRDMGIHKGHAQTCTLVASPLLEFNPTF